MSSLSEITAVILAGGVGSRLRGVTALPKAVVPVFDRPFIAYILDALHRAGIREAVICTGYRSELVEETVRAAGPPGLQLLFSAEREPLGTGGALRMAAAGIKTELALVLNGDSYCDLELSRLAAFHARHPRAVSLVAAHVADVARYGHLSVDAHGRISGFNEKGIAGPGWINAGIYLIPIRLLSELPDRVPLSLEKEVFPLWLADGMHAHRVEDAFLDIGTPESYPQKEGFVAALQARACSTEVGGPAASPSP